MLDPVTAPPLDRAARRPATPPVAVALLVFVYFAAWALLRPPLQTPDEPQHLMKATSILLQPWQSAPGRFDLDPRFLNPLAHETPHALDKLFFKPYNALTSSEIEGLRRVRWPATDAAPGALKPYERAIASYPSLYYLAVFTVAQPIVHLLGLSPYQAIYAYRLTTAAFAAGIWALVWVVLSRTPELSALAPALFAFVLVNPMLAFISSGVTPDAVNDALCHLALLLLWRLATRGESALAAGVVLCAAALTKPSGLQFAGVAIAVLALLAVTGRIDRRKAARAAAVAAGAGLVAVATFYAWTPPLFMAGGPSNDTFRQFAITRLREAGVMWRMFWGQLGWIDYSIPGIWFALVAVAIAANAAGVVWRPRRPSAPAWYLAGTFVLFAAVTFAGEYRYLPVAGYTFQGRYLLPVAMGLGSVMWHEAALLRRLLLASIIVINVLLAHETAKRYYVDRWAGVWQALPFAPGPLEKGTP